MFAVRLCSFCRHLAFARVVAAARDLLRQDGMSFLNRTDAGRQLAGSLRATSRTRPIVIGITRGGVPVAAEVARELGAPLEICVVRKMVAPGPPPRTIGAVAEGDVRYLDEMAIARLGLSTTEVDDIATRATTEVDHLAQLFRDHRPLEIRGRDVILVDDGLLTGGTMRAAAWSVRGHDPRRITLAIPVANADALDLVRPDVDYAVCLEVDRLLAAIGARYADFWPVSEAEVVDLLAGSRREHEAALAVGAMI